MELFTLDNGEIPQDWEGVWLLKRYQNLGELNLLYHDCPERQHYGHNSIIYLKRWDPRQQDHHTRQILP